MSEDNGPYIPLRRECDDPHSTFQAIRSIPDKPPNEPQEFVPPSLPPQKIETAQKQHLPIPVAPLESCRSANNIRKEAAHIRALANWLDSIADLFDGRGFPDK